MRLADQHVDPGEATGIPDSIPNGVLNGVLNAGRTRPGGAPRPPAGQRDRCPLASSRTVRISSLGSNGLVT